MINTLEQGAVNLKEVPTELALSLTPKEAFENGLDRKGVKALKRLSPKPYPDLIREINRDLDQLRLYLPHLLYDQAQTSAAYVLLHVKQQELPVEKRQDLTGLVQFEARTKANWSIKPDVVGDNELIREIKEKEKTSELYELLTSAFYLYYAGWLPLYLHDSVRAHYILREKDCRMLGSMVRSQLPMVITDCLEMHFAAYTYLLERLERTWRIAWKMVKKTAGLYVGAPVGSYWLLETLRRTEDRVGFTLNHMEENEAFLAELENLLGALQYSLRLSCEHMPSLEGVRLWPLTIM